MTHINELLADLLARSSEEDHAQELYGPHIHKTKLAVAATEEAGAAIIDPWNAAEKAMRKFISDWYWRDGDEWQCGICHASNSWHEEWHTPETCSISSHQAALAKMTDLHETADVV